MDCQPRLDLEQNAKPFKRSVPVRWIQSNSITSSHPGEVGIALEMSPTSTEQGQGNTHLEQCLAQAILTSKNLHEVLSGLARMIGEAFLVEGCLIVSQFSNRSISQISDWYSDATIGSTDSSSTLLSLLNHPTLQSGLTTEPLAICNTQTIFCKKSTTPNTKLIQKVAAVFQNAFPEIGSILAVRTCFQGQLNGMIVMLRSQPYAWKETDVQLLKSLSPQVAIAISQTQLEQQVQQQIRYQNLINQLTTAIRNTRELDEIFQLTAQGTASALQASRSLILLFKYTDPLHRSRSPEGLANAKARVVAEWSALTDLLSVSESQEDDQTFWASNCSVCQQILAGRTEPVMIPVDYSFSEHDLKQLISKAAPVFCLESMPALLLVPLENQGTVLGCLVIQHHQYRLWSLEEITFVKLAAAQLSTAIIQTRTLQQIQALVQERTAQLQRSLEVQAKLYEKTRQQVEQLRRLNEEREEFLSTISHELRTPLTSMTLAIRMLRQADLPPERQTKYLDILEQQCVQETQLVNDLLALRKLETNSTVAQLQKLDIRYFVRDVARSIEDELFDKDLKLELELPTKPLAIYTEPDSLNRILTELLTNAKKYSDPGSTVHLEITHETKPPASQIVLTLKNIGSGILPEELPHIFDKFKRGHGVTKQAIQGTGLGLALVKGLVEHLGGAIVASSDPLKPGSSWQTCFTLTLPQCPEELAQASS